MKDTDQLLKKSYKSEADEVLFQDLNFDPRMKDKILRSLHPPLKQKAPGGWFNHNRMKWIYGSMTAAAAIVVLFIALPMVNYPPSSSAPPIINSATPLTTFVDGPSPAQMKKWKLPNVTEAKAVYGEGLYLPSYTPDAYVNDNIDAYGTANDVVSKVVFSYTTENSSYDLVVEKKGSLEAVVNDEKIQINGVTGYIHSDEIGTTLFWVLDDSLYSIIGMLPREEAIRVAQSIQP
jgi:hypothetical protein